MIKKPAKSTKKATVVKKTAVVKKKSAPKKVARVETKQPQLPLNPKPDETAYGFETEQVVSPAPIVGSEQATEPEPTPTPEPVDQKEVEPEVEVKEEVQDSHPPEVPVTDLDAPLKVESVPEEEITPPLEKKNRTLLLAGIIITAAIIACAIGIAIVSFFFRQSTQAVPTSVTPTIIPPTTIPTIDPSTIRAKWTIDVLNGSGVAGMAAKAADHLKELGYTVAKTDNAKRSNYTDSELYISENIKNSTDILLSDLKTAFGIATISGTFDDSTAAARLIIGKNEAK